VASNPEGQRPLIYLVSSVLAVVKAGLGWVFTTGHADMQPLSGFYDSIEDLPLVDWKVVHARERNDTPQNPDRKRRKQAEFLVYRFFPWNLVEQVVVLGEAVKAESESVLRDSQVNPTGYVPPAQMNPAWYY
jgi:hypothetical protein